MRRAGSPIIGALTGGILAAGIGFFGFMGASALHVYLVDSVGGDAALLRGFYDSTGLALRTGVVLASALFGGWQGYDRGGFSGGLVGALVAPVLPIALGVLAAMLSVQ